MVGGSTRGCKGDVGGGGGGGGREAFVFWTKNTSYIQSTYVCKYNGAGIACPRVSPRRYKLLSPPPPLPRQPTTARSSPDTTHIKPPVWPGQVEITLASTGAGPSCGAPPARSRRWVGIAVIRRRVVRVPASSANLGPGYDCLAAALGMHLQLEVIESGDFSVQTELAVARGRENLCVRAFETLHPAEDFTFRIASEIPLSGGLGSSAAAIVAGLMAADHLFELDVDLLACATEIEGHPDNVAAAINGGFVICADDKATRFEAPTGLEAIAVVPELPVRTSEARR